MCAFVLGLPESKVRVIAPDVGGGFGSKIFLYPEDVALVWASKRVGRPIKWTAERSEVVPHRRARPRPRHARRAGDGRATASSSRCACKTIANMGAYLSTFASCVPTILYATLLAGQYTTPAIYAEVKAVFTNTAPVDAYRGAGRPEATYVVERIVEQAAREMKMDPAAIRRQNFIPTFPYATPVGLTYDTGDYAAHLDKAMRDGRRRRLSGAQGGLGSEGQDARPRLLLLHRGLRPRAVEHRRRARRARGPVRGRRGARPSDRHGHRLHRLAQPRPGPRDDVRAGRRGPARHPGRERRDRARRHRPHSVRHGHLRQPLALGRRHGDRQGGRQDHRQGQEDRRAPARGGRQPTSSSRTASSRSRAPTRRCLRATSRSTAYVPHNYPLDKLEPGLERERVLRPDQLHLSGRHATSARSRSTRTRARCRSSSSSPSTTSATSSIR